MGSCFSKDVDSTLSNEVADATKKQSELTDIEEKSEATSPMMNTVTSQYAQAFASKLFNTTQPDATKCKLVIPPIPVNWETGHGDIQIRNFCNQMPSYNGIFYTATAEVIPNAYNTAISAIPPTQTTLSKEYKEAQDALAKADTDLDQQKNILVNDWHDWMNGQRADGLPVNTYKTWKDYAENEEPGKYNQFNMYLSQQKSAQSTFNTISAQGEMGPVKKAVAKFGKWSDETKDGTVGQDANWDVSGGIKQTISGWIQGKYTEGGQIEVTKHSASYNETIVSSKFSCLFDDFAIGGNGNGSSVWHSDSTYSITIKWKASASTILKPPSVYDFGLIKSNRTHVYSNQQKYNPLTGTDKSPFQNVPTTAHLMFGVSIEGKFDKTTYQSIKTQASAGVVVFGIFSIGANVSHVQTEFHEESCSFKSNADTETAYIVGINTDPLV